MAAEVEVVNDDLKVKDLVRFLGIKDGCTASMASQGTLSDEVIQVIRQFFALCYSWVKMNLGRQRLKTTTVTTSAVTEKISIF